MMTAKGKLQRIAADDISVIGRNTQGVRIMNVDEGDSVIAVVRVPAEEKSEEDESAEVAPNAADVIDGKVVVQPVQADNDNVSTDNVSTDDSDEESVTEE